MTTGEEPGFEELDPLVAKELVDAGAILLDVREDDEWEAGRAPGAVHIRLGELEARCGEIPVDKTVVCVCRGGGRSARAAGALAAVGYTTVNLAGGMRAWSEAELPVLDENGDAGAVI